MEDEDVFEDLAPTEEQNVSDYYDMIDEEEVQQQQQRQQVEIAEQDRDNDVGSDERQVEKPPLSSAAPAFHAIQHRPAPRNAVIEAGRHHSSSSKLNLLLKKSNPDANAVAKEEKQLPKKAAPPTPASETDDDDSSEETPQVASSSYKLAIKAAQSHLDNTNIQCPQKVTSNGVYCRTITSLYNLERLSVHKSLLKMLLGSASKAQVVFLHKATNKTWLGSVSCGVTKTYGTLSCKLKANDPILRSVGVAAGDMLMLRRGQVRNTIDGLPVVEIDVVKGKLYKSSNVVAATEKDVSSDDEESSEAEAEETSVEEEQPMASSRAAILAAQHYLRLASIKVPQKVSGTGVYYRQIRDGGMHNLALPGAITRLLFGSASFTGDFVLWHRASRQRWKRAGYNNNSTEYCRLNLTSIIIDLGGENGDTLCLNRGNELFTGLPVVEIDVKRNYRFDVCGDMRMVAVNGTQHVHQQQQQIQESDSAGADDVETSSDDDTGKQQRQEDGEEDQILPSSFLEDIQAAQQYLANTSFLRRAPQVVFDDGTYSREVTTAVTSEVLTIKGTFVQLLLGENTAGPVVFVHRPTDRRWYGKVNNSINADCRCLKLSTMLKDLGASLGDTLLMKRMHNRIDGLRAVAVELKGNGGREGRLTALQQPTPHEQGQNNAKLFTAAPATHQKPAVVPEQALAVAAPPIPTQRHLSQLQVSGDDIDDSKEKRRQEDFDEDQRLPPSFLQDIRAAQLHILEKGSRAVVPQEVYDDGTYTRQVTTLRGDGLTISEKFVQLLLGVKSFVDVVFVHTPTNRKWRGWVNSSDPGFRSLKFSFTDGAFVSLGSTLAAMLKDLGASLGDTLLMKRMKNRVDGLRAVAVKLHRQGEGQPSSIVEETANDQQQQQQHQEAPAEPIAEQLPNVAVPPAVAAAMQEEQGHCSEDAISPPASAPIATAAAAAVAVPAVQQQQGSKSAAEKETCSDDKVEGKDDEVEVGIHRLPGVFTARPHYMTTAATPAKRPAATSQPPHKRRAGDAHPKPPTPAKPTEPAQSIDRLRLQPNNELTSTLSLVSQLGSALRQAGIHSRDIGRIEVGFFGLAAGQQQIVVNTLRRIELLGDEAVQRFAADLVVKLAV